MGPLWKRMVVGAMISVGASYVALLIAREVYFLTTGEYPHLGIWGL